MSPQQTQQKDKPTIQLGLYSIGICLIVAVLCWAGFSIVNQGNEIERMGERLQSFEVLRTEFAAENRRRIEDLEGRVQYIERRERAMRQQ